MEPTSTRKRFSALLPSDPVWMPFGGSFEGVAIQADQDRVMGLGQHLLEIAGDQQAEIDVLRSELNKVQIAFTRKWGNHEGLLRARARAQDMGSPLPFPSVEDEIAWLEQNDAYRSAQLVYSRMLDLTTKQMGGLRRQINLLIIQDTIIRIGVPVTEEDRKWQHGMPVTWTWPYEDEIPPDPKRPETLEGWPDMVLEWMADTAQEEVRKQLQSPNLNGR